MIVIGIDNGLDGAIVGLDADTGELVGWYDCQTMPTGKGSRRTFAVRLMAASLRELVAKDSRGRAHAIIERAQPMPKQGAAQMFGTGFGAGIWQGIVAAKGLPFETVTPRVWMRSMLAGISGEGKQRALIAAENLFPDLPLTSERGTKPTKHGRADAALLAEYGRRKLRGA